MAPRVIASLQNLGTLLFKGKDMINMYLDELWKNIQNLEGSEVCVHGWIRNHRPQKEFGFIDFSDGTCMKHLQIVYDRENENFLQYTSLSNGSAIHVTGILKKSEGKGQDYELKAQKIVLLGDCPEEYPLQPKRHSPEFLRSIAYLRPRVNLYQAVFRIRSLAAMAIHEYFQNHGFVYVHTPLITTAACEGEDQMFKITTFDFDNLPKKDGHVDFKEDLFKKQAYITGSGQLQGEAFATAFSKIYTFGPTFRTENSNTKTHANEFWMIEPEMAFCDLNGLMDIEEEMLKFVVNYVLERAQDELIFLDKFQEPGLLEKLRGLVSSKFIRVTHEEVITILKNANVKFENIPEYGEDISKEHERYITEHFSCPVFITDWPKDIKSFYMKLNDDGKTVRGVDLEIPGIGELMGGSEREASYEKLYARMMELDMKLDDMEWYLNLRKFGSVVHSGFGLGFERLILYLTGVENIRDVIPFPRTPGSCEF